MWRIKRKTQRRFSDFLFARIFDLGCVVSLWEIGALRPYVDSTYEFGSALDAYDRRFTGRVTGKVIVKVE